MKTILRLLGVLIVVGAIGCILNDPFLYMVPFCLVCYILFAIALLAIIVLPGKALWNSLLRRRCAPKWEKRVYYLTSLTIVLVLLFVFASATSREPSEEERLEKLKSLPYLVWTSVMMENADKRGISIYDHQKTYNGLNFYNHIESPSAHIMTMSGDIIHSWFAEMNPDDKWMYVKLLPDGDILALVEYKRLERLDWNSRIEWAIPGRFHHDIAKAPNGDIYSLSRKDDIIYYHHLPVPVLNDRIMIFSATGIKKGEIPLLTALENYVPPQRIVRLYRWVLSPKTFFAVIQQKVMGKPILTSDTPADIMHINNVEILKRGLDGIYKKGDLLISARDLDLVFVMDPATRDIKWSWGPGEISQQHNPAQLENGNILIFDNGVGRYYSRVIELDPLTKKIVWEYKENPPERFYTFRRGANERLPNGNTLITESDKGRVFEVTPEGEIVWEFFNPINNPRDENQRAALYRFARIIDPDMYPCLKRLEKE